MYDFFLYTIAILFSASLLSYIHRNKNAPQVIFVILGLAFGFLLLILLIDSKKLNKIDLIVAGKKYGIQSLEQEIDCVNTIREEQIVVAQKELEFRIRSLEKIHIDTMAIDKTPMNLKYNKILWVNDRPKKNENLSNFLRNELNLTIVLSTDNAIFKLENDTVQFDAVISDMGRREPPNSNNKNDQAGIELLKEIRKSIKNRSIPVYIYSSRWDLKRQALEAGAKEFTNSADTLLNHLGFGPPP